MISSDRLSTYARRLSPLIGVILFAAAVWVLHDALRQFHYHHVLAWVQAMPTLAILSALGLTVLSYAVMTGYDRLGIAYIGHPLGTGRVSAASFISYAFSNTIGLSLLTSGSIRYRLYSAWGLSAEEVGRLVAFTTATFWLGIVTVAGIVFLAEPTALPPAGMTLLHSARPVGLLFTALVLGYLLLVALRREPLRFRNWTIPLPSGRLTALQLLTGSLDWLLAGAVLFVLMPEQAQFTFFQFLGIYLLAQMVALVSHVPGGLGVFESMILLSTPQVPADALIGTMLIYRGIYYLLPLTVAALLLGIHELTDGRRRFGKAVRQIDHWWGAVIPHLLAATTLLSGAVLLFSGATPAVSARLQWLDRILPLPVIELSHFLGSLAGVCLLVLARALQRRIDLAYLLTAVLLAGGSILSLLKGQDYEEALLLTLILAALLPCRKQFYRRAPLFKEPWNTGWILTIVAVLAASLWLGFFSYKHVSFSSELWWQFTLEGNAPRSLRAAVGSTVLLLAFALARLLRPVPPTPLLPSREDLESARQIISRTPQTLPQLALLGDKTLFFDEERRGFVMYGIEGQSWVSLGNPVGPPENARELAWRYRELVELHGGQTVFYEVDTTMLNVYLDMGLTLFKIGENAAVPLTGFSLEGPGRKGLRYSHRRLAKEGCSFTIVPTGDVPALLPELRKISDEWLREKNTREKGFSLGRFDEGYLSNFPIAVVRRDEKIVAFANLWLGADNAELSFDLMRFGADAPKGVMDFLFIGLMLWGMEHGCQAIDLGMAPLSGLDNRPFAPLWNRVGAAVFRYGEHFYNFEGLREYKQKFDPVWESRYLACPGGLLALPQILLNVTALIGGGLRGVIAK